MISNIDAYKKYVAPESPSRYFKLADGKSARIQIASECFLYHDEYKGRISTRYAWVIYNLTESMAQVWQASVTTFKAVQGLVVNEEWGDPTGYNVIVTREGVGKETTYSIQPSRKSQVLKSEQLEAVDNFDLYAIIEDATPLSRADEFDDEPTEPRRPTHKDAEAVEGDDVVIQDLDDEPPIRVEDIPF